MTLCRVYTQIREKFHIQEATSPFFYGTAPKYDSYSTVKESFSIKTVRKTKMSAMAKDKWRFVQKIEYYEISTYPRWLPPLEEREVPGSEHGRTACSLLTARNLRKYAITVMQFRNPPMLCECKSGPVKSSWTKMTSNGNIYTCPDYCLHLRTIREIVVYLPSQ